MIIDGVEGNNVASNLICSKIVVKKLKLSYNFRIINLN